MAEWLLLPVVQGVVSKAADGLVQSIARMWGADDDRERLERRLVYVQSLLADAEAKSETNLALRTWMKALKAVAYKADDVLDDFQYESLRLEDLSRGSTTSKVKSYFTLENPLVLREKVSRDLKDVLGKIDELVTELNMFGLAERREVPHVLYRQTHSSMDESEEIYGRDDDKEAVVKLLLDQKDQRNLQVLPIIGMGGLGKTTLAKMVYNDSTVQKHFQLKMWHCVSENFEAPALLRSVIELATKGKCDLPENVELLRGRLQEVIGRKRFLLVLDDVWNEKHHKWENDLKPLLCSLGGSGSMILVTSRSRRVASIMGTCPPYELVCLSEDDSWELFSTRAFGKDVEKEEELVTIGKRIVNKCKGLPLALKTMGSLMSSKQQADEWEAIADCNISDTSGGKDEVMPILKLSYKHLSPEMKQCFAFCAVFPKDYEMEKDILMQLWMANGYIHEERTMSLVQKSEFIFNELTRRSFLQDFKILRIPRSSFPYDPKQELIACKMHDLMHDLAKDVSSECATVEELVHGKVPINGVYHLHISGHDKLNKITQLSASTIYLRTLLTPSSWDKDLVEAKLMSSRALCFKTKDVSVIHRQLINTSHLRYLDLSYSQIVSLPDSICMLYNLLSLRLNSCSQLQYLPDGMSSMRKLSHIYLLLCHNLERMPPNLHLLHNLRTLTTFVVDDEDGHGIEELEDLRHLGNRLELYNLRRVKYGSKANLHQKNNINELLLDWSHFGHNMYEVEIGYEASNEEHTLESLVPHKNLKSLEVCGYRGINISHWMRQPQMFNCLRELVMSHCRRCKDLPIIWLSPSLERLFLWGMGGLTTLCKNIDVEPVGDSTSLQIFPKLKTLELMYLPELENLAEFGAGKVNSLVLFPELKVLTIRGCGKLEILLESSILTDLHVYHSNNTESSSHRSMSKSLGFLPSLVRLKIESRMVEDQQSKTPLDTLQSGDSLPIFSYTILGLGVRDCLSSVEELEIYRCNNIVHLPLEEFRCLPHLRSLIITYCEKLEEIGSSLEEDEILPLPLPLLERLSIGNCDTLLAIPLLPASLEELFIYNCSGLLALPSNLGNLANLRALVVSRCNGLKVLPDEMDGLISLELLQIRECLGIEEFPEGLLRRLPSLGFLHIWDNSNLERRCREGGEYFHLVSSIPRKEILHTNRKRKI